MLPTALLLILLKLIFETGPAYSQTLYASKNPVPVGSNVTLSVQYVVTTGAWIFNNSMIVMMYPGNHIISTKWKDKVTLNLTSNQTSLTINSLWLQNSGEYVLHDLEGVLDQSSVQLSVQEPISNVTLKAQATDLVEFNDSAVFTCSASSGTSVSYAWLNGSRVITGSKSVQLSDGGAKLTIVVTRYDQGPFSCNMSNGISHEVSSLVYLKISYGPSNAMVTLQPMKLAYRTGDNITLSCSADSSPAARIWWRFDGMDLNTTGPQLHLQSVRESNSGNYTCMLHNNVTSRFSSESKMIRILSPVTEASVHIVGSQPILNNSFTLTCRTTGTVDSITWMHNWSLLYSDETRVLSMDNATLTFSSVMLSDNGNYSCMASNAVSNISSQWFMLDIFYGPEKSWISGPVTARIGRNVTLICHAPSNPPSSYKWIFNGSVVADTFTYVTPPFTAEMNRTYTCMAHNNVTGKNSTAHTMINALYPITDVQVEAPKKEAVEGQHYTLTCNVTGPPDLLTVDLNWFKNGHWLQVDNQTTFFTDHKNIMFNPLQKNHSGQYHCNATNAVSAVASPPYLLLVKFGPETPVITGPEFAEIGTTAHFNCSANSYPPSTFTWWFNGSEVANSSMLTTAPLSFNMSGAYTCVADNDVTGRNRSTTVVLTVVEAIELVITNSSVPIQHENLTLTCEVTGPYEQIYWLKDDMHLNANTSTTNGSMSNHTMSNDTMSNDTMSNHTMSNHTMSNDTMSNHTMSNHTMSNHTMSYHIENNTLHFTPVTLYDDGVYKCVASSEVGEHPSAPFSLLVNYGPLSVHISGPGSAHMGSMVTLVCSASSRPDCDFYWYINNQASILSTGPAITFPALKPHEGNYTCVARNPVTNIILHQSTRFAVVVGKSAVLQVPSYGALLLSVFALSLTTFLHGGGLPA